MSANSANPAASSSLSNKMFAVQQGIKQNASELSSYLSDLRSWESEMSAKDDALRAGKIKLTKRPLTSLPIRSHQSSNSSSSASSVTSSSSSTDEIRFTESKSEGNAAYLRNDYETAILHYTQCTVLKPNDSVSYNNRCQCYLKLNRFVEAESDASAALKIESAQHSSPSSPAPLSSSSAAGSNTTVIKALFRRASARKELRKIVEARKDLERLLFIDSKNTAARDLLKELQLMDKEEKEKEKEKEKKKVEEEEKRKKSGIASVNRRRLVIEEVDDDSDLENEVDRKEMEIEKKELGSGKKEETDRKNSGIEVERKASAEATKTETFTSPLKGAGAPQSPKHGEPSSVAPITPSKPPLTSIASASSSQSTSSPSTSSLKPPQTSFEFESRFRALVRAASTSSSSAFSWPSAMYDLLRSLPPAKLSSLLQSSLDASLLSAVISCLSTFIASTTAVELDAKHWFAFLWNLMGVARFSVTVMRMERPEKAKMREIVQWLGSWKVAEGKQLQKLAEKYEIDG